MKKSLITLAAASAAVTLAGCASAPKSNTPEWYDASNPCEQQHIYKAENGELMVRKMKPLSERYSRMSLTAARYGRSADAINYYNLSMASKRNEAQICPDQPILR